MKIPLLMKKPRKQGLTVRTKAEVVLLDAAAHREAARQVDAVASIRRSLAQAREGMGRPAEDVFDDLEREDASG